MKDKSAKSSDPSRSNQSYEATFVRYERDGLIEHGLLNEEIITAIDGSIFGEFLVTDSRYSINDVRLLAPLQPKTIYGLGMNSHSYRKFRMGTGYPGIDSDEPPVYQKSANSIVGPSSRLVIPRGATGVSGSPELAVVIGKRAHGITEEEAENYVLGYTASFDAMAPELIRSDAVDENVVNGKDFPTFCPLGPYIKTKIDTSDLEVSLRINGHRFHEGRSSDFIYSVAKVVSFLASKYTLEAGDVILMGALGQEGVVDGKEIDTSSMVARFTNIKTSRTLSYPKYRAGDQMEVYIENIGSFRFVVTCEGEAST